MLTFEKVLEVFSDYLSQDPDYEVVMTSRGYTLMGWNDKDSSWIDVQYCGTPEVLRDALLASCENYLSYVALDLDGRDELTKQEKEKVNARCNALMEKCQA